MDECKHPEAEIEDAVGAPGDPNKGYCYACMNPVEKINNSWQTVECFDGRALWTT